MKMRDILNEIALKEIPMGKYIGNCEANACYKNAILRAKNDKNLDVYYGEIQKGNSKNWHVFNVDKNSGKVVEYSPVLGSTPTEYWKKHFKYFGVKIPEDEYETFMKDSKYNL